MKTKEKLAASFVQKLVVREMTGWPPVCNGLIYQPERPMYKVENMPSADHHKSTTMKSN